MNNRVVLPDGGPPDPPKQSLSHDAILLASASVLAALVSGRDEAALDDDAFQEAMSRRAASMTNLLFRKLFRV